MTGHLEKTLQTQKQSTRPQNATMPAPVQLPATAQLQATQQVGTAPAVHPALVPEVLGFSPQMLLDDIISAAADAILQCLQAMEPFMQRWADARVSRAAAEGRSQMDAEWDGREAVEQGLVAFSTLLESHTDIAFDFFEAWSLRNIFAVPPALPLIVPHQRGLNLSTPSEEETSLITEIEELRRKFENQRRLMRMYTRALRISRLGLTRSCRRLARLSYLSTQPTDSSTTPTPEAALKALLALPSSIQALFDHASSLPHIDGPLSTIAPSAAAGAGGAVVSQPGHDPARRLWETNQMGYITWAVSQLLVRARERGVLAAKSKAATVSVIAAENEDTGRDSGNAGTGGGQNDRGDAVGADVLITRRIGAVDSILQLARDLNAESPLRSTSSITSTQDQALSRSTARSRTRTPERMPLSIPMQIREDGDEEKNDDGDGYVIDISPSEDEHDYIMDTS